MDNNNRIAGGKTALVAFAVLMTTVYSAMANLPPQKQDFSTNETLNFSTILTFNKFNASDTLTSVKISLNSQINGGTIIIDNDGDSNVSGTLKFGISGNVNSTEVNLPLLSGTNVFPSQPFYLDSDVNDVEGDYNPLPPDGMQFTGSNNSGGAFVLVEDTFLNNYIGSGTFNVVVSISPYVNYGDFLGIKYSITDPVNTDGYVEVVYNIPEPATISILGLGALSLLRRKNKQ